MRIFLIGPEEEIAAQREAVRRLETDGHRVHWPRRDTPQNDPIGLKICEANRAAIEAAEQVRVRYDPASEEVAFDLAMAFALGKQIIFISGEEAASENRCFVALTTSLVQATEYKEVSVFWNPAARIVSISFLGVVFALRKKIKLDNPGDLRPTPHKSFENILLALAGKL